MDRIMRQAKSTAKSSTCHVCNAEARLINYGALSCHSCKTFFHHYACRTQDVRPCCHAGHCTIILKARKTCTACRLAKCFAVGMRPEFIRKEVQSKKTGSSVEYNNREIALRHQTFRPFSQITPLDLLCNDRSSLTTFEWELLSNVIHAFDKFSPVISIQRTIQHLNTIKPSINDDVSSILKLFVSCDTSVQSFITSIPDFRILTTAEQRSLFQRNLHALYIFAGNLMLRDGGLYSDTGNERFVVSIYGDCIMRRGKQIIMRMDSNSTLVKIITTIFAFSTNCYTVSFDKNTDEDVLLKGSFRLLGSQNMYVEILWKYMLYRYGYMQSVLRFAGLVKQILDLITLSAGIYHSNTYQQILVDDVIEQAKTTLTLTDIDATPLWGKL